MFRRSVVPSERRERLAQLHSITFQKTAVFKFKYIFVGMRAKFRNTYKPFMSDFANWAEKTYMPLQIDQAKELKFMRDGICYMLLYQEYAGPSGRAV